MATGRKNKHAPFHDNEQTFIAVERILVDIENLNDVFTVWSTTMQLNFSSCFRHIS